MLSGARPRLVQGENKLRYKRSNLMLQLQGDPLGQVLI